MRQQRAAQGSRAKNPGRSRNIDAIVGTFNPARFANYFRELAAIITETGTTPDRDHWAELYSRYDTTFYEAS